MDSLDLLRRTVAETDTLVMGLRDDQLSLATPCTDWTVRDLLNHVVAGATMFAISAEQGEIPDADLGRLSGDVLGDDYKGAWTAASTRALAAFDIPGVLDKTVKLPFGEMPAGVALNIAVFDVATHATDLATATGATITDEGLLEDALAMGKQMITPEWRRPGVFDDEKPCPDAAPVATRLQAFAGRAV